VVVGDGVGLDYQFWRHSLRQVVVCRWVELKVPPSELEVPPSELVQERLGHSVELEVPPSELVQAGRRRWCHLTP
jgi:hypothetical protein